MTNNTSRIIQHSTLQYSLYAVGLFGFGLQFAESFFYPGVVQRYLGVNSVAVLWGCLTYFTLLRIVAKTTIPSQFSSFLFWYIVPILSVFTVFLNIAPDILYTNFSFQMFHLHPAPMQIVSSFSVAFAAVSFNISVWKEKFYWSAFVTPIILWSHLLFFKWRYVGTWFWKLRVEDGPFEYATAISFLLVSIFAAKLAKKIYASHNDKNLRIFFTSVFSVVALCSFVVAGEEISWGQRILGFATPEDWAAINTQEETTLHNHEEVLKYVYQAYFILSLYAMVSWIVKAIIHYLASKKVRKWLELVSPNWYLMPFFIPTFLYTLGRFTIGWTYYGLGAWEETTEMILSLGLLFFMIDIYKRFNQNK